jgi:uncharacterized RmlC-like cupin family protein
MTRRQGVSSAGVSILEVTTQPETFSGWHHHGEHTTCGYVIDGSLRFEWGPGGQSSVELQSGDFFVVPPQTVHREGNPGTTMQRLVGFRLGTGPSVVNVDGPDPAG